MSLTQTSVVAGALDALAHDLRNRVNVVVTGARLAADDRTDPLAVEVLDATRQLGALVDRCIEVARIEIGSDPRDREDVALELIVRAAVRRAARDWGVEVGPSATMTIATTAHVATIAAIAERVLADAIALMCWTHGSVTLTVADCVVTVQGAGAADTPPSALPNTREREVLRNLARASAQGASIDITSATADAMSLAFTHPAEEVPR